MIQVLSKYTPSLFLCALVIALAATASAQDDSQAEQLNISGNAFMIFQQYSDDAQINATAPPEQAAMNAFSNIYARYGNFTAGLRLESYSPILQGYVNPYDGTGIGNYFVEFNDEKLTFTAGSIYEQFGSGLALRTFEDPYLGVDNSIFGMRVRFKPTEGISLKGVYGRQRLTFQEKIIAGEGLVRGIDAQFELNQLVPALKDSKVRYALGGSWVSKYQEDKNPTYLVPENVAIGGGRLDVTGGKVNFNAEYVYKANDPSADNAYIFKPGEALLLGMGYSKKGLGVAIQAKSADNFVMRSDRNENQTNLLVNFNPALTKQHTYVLVATLYPYATNINGEVAYQADLNYKVPKGSKLGGKYGMGIDVNAALALAPEREYIDDLDDQRQFYSTDLFSMSDSVFYQDINIALTKKFSKKFKGKLTYFNINIDGSATGVTEEKKLIESHTLVFEGNWKIKPKHALRFELQSLMTEKDKGDWAAAVVEYTVSPHWFFALLDQYNYGNPIEDRQIHYLYGTLGYSYAATRIALGFGKQRAGIFCVGGQCRPVPASYGLNISLNANF